MGGRIIKIVNTSAVHLLLKRGGGLHSKGAYFRVSTVILYKSFYNKSITINIMTHDVVSVADIHIEPLTKGIY